MIAWRPVRTAALKAVPEPLAGTFLCGAAVAGSVLLISVLGAMGGLSRTSVVLGALSALAALLGVSARFHAALGVALVCWLFLNFYGVAPRGELTWQGRLDAARFVVLAAAACLGTLVARVVNAARAYRRITPRQGP